MVGADRTEAHVELGGRPVAHASAGGGREITVGIVEDHAMVAQGLAAAIGSEPGMAVGGVAHTLADGLSLVRDTPCDVLLMDVRLPDGDGATGARDVSELSPRTKVLILSASADHDVLRRAIAAGADGFVSKSEGLDKLVDAVRGVAAGQAQFSADVLRKVVRKMDASPANGGIGNDLTSREREVLQLLANGASTDDIAEALFLSQHTVRNHVRNLSAKLGAHSKLEAVAIAARKGIVKLGSS